MPAIELTTLQPSRANVRRPLTPKTLGEEILLKPAHDVQKLVIPKNSATKRLKSRLDVAALRELLDSAARLSKVRLHGAQEMTFFSNLSLVFALLPSVIKTEQGNLERERARLSPYVREADLEVVKGTLSKMLGRFSGMGEDVSDMLRGTLMGFAAIHRMGFIYGLLAILDALRLPNLSSQGYVNIAKFAYDFFDHSDLHKVARDIRSILIDGMLSRPAPAASKKASIGAIASRFLRVHDQHELTPQRLLQLADACPQLTTQLSVARRFLRDLVEPVIVTSGNLNDSEWAKLRSQFGNLPTFRYTRARLGCMLKQPDSLPSSDFPFARKGRDLLLENDANLLVVDNRCDGRGDEIARNWLLLQALFIAKNESQVTIVTRRPELYNHPNIVPISHEEYLDDRRRIHKRHRNLIFHTDQTQWVDKAVHKFRPNPKHFGVFVYTTKTNDDFLIDQCWIAGTEISKRRGLCYRSANSVYDPSFRLLCELGLPIAHYDGHSPIPSILVTTPYPHADETWKKLVASIDGARRSITGLVPFGGMDPSKGFSKESSHKISDVVKLLNSECENGGSVVIFPNDSAWGNSSKAKQLRSQVDSRLRRYVAVAPAPSEDPKLATYLYPKCDRMYAVEGGAMHTLYALGIRATLLWTKGAGEDKWIPPRGSLGPKLVSHPHFLTRQRKAKRL